MSATLYDHFAKGSDMFRRLGISSMLVAVGLVAASCTETAAPGIGQGNGPLFSYSQNGITLNQCIGTQAQSGTLLIKGFNTDGICSTGSPKHGDAVIATFYWVGSTNIIDSVADVMTDSPYSHIEGNTFHLVKYVTAG